MAHFWGIAIWGAMSDPGHPLMNPSFEDAGADRGEADWWTEDLSATAEDTAPFTHSDGYTLPWEAFEADWGLYPYNQNAQTEFGITDLSTAMFEDLSNPVESFEFSWREPATGAPVTFNHQAASVLSVDNFTAAKFDSGVESEEDYEEYWGSSPYNQESIYDFASGTFTRGLFDAGTDNEEDFENDWGIDLQNQSSETVFDPANFTVASFDSLVPENLEDFEDEWTEALIT